jgi:hypothetical protein
MMKSDTRNDGTEQATDEVVGYGGLAGGVLPTSQLRLPATLPGYVPDRSIGEEIPQFRPLPLPTVPVLR